MRVSFLEIYNEELFDLLSLSMDNQKMRLFEDSARKVRKYHSAVWSRSRLTLLHLNNTCTGLEINFLVYWSIVQCIQIFTGQNASCTGQVQEQLK